MSRSTVKVNHKDGSYQVVDVSKQGLGGFFLDGIVESVVPFEPLNSIVQEGTVTVALNGGSFVCSRYQFIRLLRAFERTDAIKFITMTTRASEELAGEICEELEIK